ncbi:hypothetical protein KUTeg_001057 [Tegillarca granosa]|uniref:Uncharacterized protein n=1 Tax=Tegillarca granosa TaxID=220873 RepID=A0ABQ9G090_TEGGR|nr:hypothetical protein KUTeg_001057 [Tegillarca granosa]
MDNETRRKSTVGEIVNLISVDCDRMEEVNYYLLYCLSVPFRLSLGLFLLWNIFGTVVLAGISVILLLFPLNMILLHYDLKLNRELMEHRDKRCKILGEVINGIKVIKLYTWELSFLKKISEIRNKELRVGRKILIIDACYVFSYGLVPFLLFNNINFEIPKGSLTAVVGQVGAGKSSLLSAILGDMDTLEGEVIVNLFCKGSFKTGSIGYVPQIAWIQNDSVRENILFGKEFKHSLYHSVVKSCCLEPDLEMILAGDLTEIGEKGINLSGGQKQRLFITEADIYLLDDPLGAVDSHVGKHIFKNVIGEEGLLHNKTRILVTHGVRWLPKADFIIVMSDGVVSEIGTYQKLLNHNGPFSKFLRTYLLEHKTEVDTNSDNEDMTLKTSLFKRLNSLSAGDADEETVEMIDNWCWHQKKYTHALSQFYCTSLINYKTKTEDANILKENKRPFSLCDDNSQVVVKDFSEIQSSECDKKHCKTIQDEEVEEGKCCRCITIYSLVNAFLYDIITLQRERTLLVHLSVYLKYLRKFGIFGFIVSLIFVLLEELSNAGGRILLSKWTEDPTIMKTDLYNTTEYKTQNILYISLYTGFGFFKTLFDLLNALVIYNGTLKVSRSLHGEMLNTVLQLPVSFFDVTPFGRILNRFSSDIEKMDKKFPTILRMATYRRYYIPTSRQLERLESKTLSPVYSFLGETLQGSSTIRAYRQQKRFIEESQRRTDANIGSRYYVIVAEES